jgi:leucyl-tRNA synthetase
MAVPAHDQRDFEFAVKFKLPIVQVVSRDGKPAAGPMSQADAEEGVAVNSGQFDGLPTEEFKKRITAWLEQGKLGRRAVNYKLRDWVFSRQRYWGEPIPLVHCDQCGTVPVPYEELPLLLPEVQSYQPTGTGESPLATITDWVNTRCPKCGGTGRRETNTMPQWAGSCWYYLRYLDRGNNRELAARDKVDYWMPVDLYVGGAEHAVLHLLYARFWHKVLYDIGAVNTDEPFQRLVNQGMILGEGGVKMSKSLGNVINPEEVIREFGADAMRLYEMFMGPLEVSKPWSTQGIAGVKRFLDRVWRLSELPAAEGAPPAELERLLHRTIKKVGEDTRTLQFNTAIAQLMIYVTELNKQEKLHPALWKPFVLLLSPYAPHLAEELWEKLGGKPSVTFQAYPQYSEELTREGTREIVFQINGKVRARLELAAGLSASELEKQALAHPRIQELLAGQKPVKVIAVPDRLVNLVVRG